MTQDAKKPEDQKEKKPARPPLFKRPAFFVTVAILLVMGVIVGIGWWFYARSHESTDDAFIDGHVIEVAPQVAGRVLKLDVSDNQEVKAGQVLVEIDPADFQARLDQAKAALAAAEAGKEAAHINVDLTSINANSAIDQAKAALDSAKSSVATAQANVAQAQAEQVAAEADAARAESDVVRYEHLDPRAVSAQQLDLARTTARSAEANSEAARKKVVAAQADVVQAESSVVEAQSKLEAAQSAPQQIAYSKSQEVNAEAQINEAREQVRQAELMLGYCTISASVPGRVTHRMVEVGAYIQIGQALLAVVPDDVWVTANFKETQLTNMKPGQDVDIEVDAYSGLEFHGKVDSIQAGTGARFSLLPPENATGNYVKVVQRVPVKIVFNEDRDKNALLAPGMSVTPTVHINQ